MAYYGHLQSSQLSRDRGFGFPGQSPLTKTIVLRNFRTRRTLNLGFLSSQIPLAAPQMGSHGPSLVGTPGLRRPLDKTESADFL